MLTNYKYIYDYKEYFLVRFKDEKSKYKQKVFWYKNRNKNKVRLQAVKWRDKIIPEFRKSAGRLLQRNPQKHKSSRLPAGISLSYSSSYRNSRTYKYPILSISAGKDKNGKPILKNLFISKYSCLDDAVEAAVIIREALIKKHAKKIQRK